MIDGREQCGTGELGQQFVRVGSNYCLKLFDNRIESGY
jgi:hypothetical protein